MSNNNNVTELLKERERLQDIKNDYLNMHDNGLLLPGDLSIIYDINERIKQINDDLNNEIEYFTERSGGGYIAGYRYFNGYRIVNVYVKSIYKNKISYNLDYTHAKIYKHYETARRVMFQVARQL